eukprot:760842-Hanusia_phi.AAC.2
MFNKKSKAIKALRKRKVKLSHLQEKSFRCAIRSDGRDANMQVCVKSCDLPPLPWLLLDLLQLLFAFVPGGDEKSETKREGGGGKG